MKKIKINLLMAFLGVTALVWSCRPDEPAPIGDPVNKIETLNGTWSLSKVVQVDNDAVKKGFPNQRLDITDLYSYQDFKLTFQLDANGNPGAFSTTPGNAPEIITVASGTWSVDDPAAPVVVTLQNGSNQAALEFTTYNGLLNNKLSLKLVRRDGEKALVSYEYEFEKN
jgi:hypothetical protein